MNRLFPYPHISVVMPVHNASATLSATVRSILSQSERDFELLLIDDGSTDQSLAIMLRLAAVDDRIRVIAHANCGVAATRNKGVELSHGQLIAFCDADDLWHPEKLKLHRALHRADHNCAASYARIAFIEPEARNALDARTTSTIVNTPLKVTDLLGENPVCTMSNLVVRRAAFERVGGFRAGMSFAEDQEWLARAAFLGLAIRGIDEVLVSYRLSHDGLSVNLERMYAGWRDLATDYADPSGVQAAEAIYCRYLARRALRSGASAATALHYAVRGLRLDARAFLTDAKRGWATLISALVAPFIPRAARIRVFA
ncbi:glycosyltransferase family 2 protein [Sphingomonas lacunae]|uniref:Glycosyltransferase family 2 protein n=1 Tax=Sphingomonas lacunae TaxID=2698828 RepID=A0A6M4AQF0_9SPHN|nr:glycosyltransferase family 2 protein [Sphingomonas lacunae]QJQ31247.1 glycosyltransferase family 2 protein [Sphingomonas lacunae]